MVRYMKYSTLNYFFRLNLKFDYYIYYLLVESAYLTENTVFLNRYPNCGQYVTFYVVKITIYFYIRDGLLSTVNGN